MPGSCLFWAIFNVLKFTWRTINKSATYLLPHCSFRPPQARSIWLQGVHNRRAHSQVPIALPFVPHQHQSEAASLCASSTSRYLHQSAFSSPQCPLLLCASPSLAQRMLISCHPSFHLNEQLTRRYEHRYLIRNVVCGPSTSVHICETSESSLACSDPGYWYWAIPGSVVLHHVRVLVAVPMRLSGV